MNSNRPEAEDEYSEEVEASKNIDNGAKRLCNLPRTPSQVFSINSVGESPFSSRICFDTTSDPAIEKKSVSDQVRRIKAIYAQRDNIIERDSGTKAYERKKDGGHHGQCNGHYRKGCFGFNLTLC